MLGSHQDGRSVWDLTSGIQKVTSLAMFARDSLVREGHLLSDWWVFAGMNARRYVAHCEGLLENMLIGYG